MWAEGSPFPKGRISELTCYQREGEADNIRGCGMVNLAKTFEVVPGRPSMALLPHKTLRQGTKSVNITHPCTSLSILLQPHLLRAN